MDFFHETNETETSQTKTRQLADKVDLIHWLRFIRDPRWNLRDKHKLLKAFSCPTNLYEHYQNEGKDADITIQKITQKPINSNSNVDRHRVVSKNRLEKDLRWMERDNAYLITINDSRYPELLKQIHDPPIALFAIGDDRILDNPMVAIVGSRKPSPVGQKVTQMLSSKLVGSGIVIVSGMALGIDGIAHDYALDSHTTTGTTIAVMGCGLDRVYPARHRRLFSSIADSGLLLSEYPPATPPLKAYFPQRNRIVSGLSLGVIIVEAAERSGTLITARFAIEQDRELFVVPGSVINPQYQGSHRLIKEGGQLITDYQDVLKSLALPLSECLDPQIKESSSQINEQLPSSDTGLLQWINYESTSVEKIILSSGLTTAQVSSMLLVLEVEGKIAKADDGGYLKLV